MSERSMFHSWGDYSERLAAELDWKMWRADRFLYAYIMAYAVYSDYVPTRLLVMAHRDAFPRTHAIDWPLLEGRIDAQEVYGVVRALFRDEGKK